ncbi:DUF6122 family protein [Aurantivibrio infirmus]
MFHLLLHFLVPLITVFVFVKKARRVKVFALLMITMLIDLDHLFATPIYDAQRCSIGFHPLHTIVPIIFYSGLSIFPKTRWIGVGLLIHVALDGIDCWV